MDNIILSVLVFVGLGILTGVLLTIASKVFEVKVDERIEEISEILPQVNCGSCGFSGCNDYATAIVENGVPVNLCTPGGGDAADKIAAVMGLSEMEVVKKVAVIHCNGNCETAKTKFEFDGLQSCSAAARFYNGASACEYGCIGYGDCERACPNDAIKVVDGLATVCREKCIGCGMCVSACPKGIIKLHDFAQKTCVTCSSKAAGKVVRAACIKGCIGCKKCERGCEAGAIKVTDNLSEIDFSLCTNCGKCVEGCPVKAITLFAE